MSWLGVLEHHARRTPDKPLAVFGDHTSRIEGMARLVGEARRRPARRGVGFGDVVALLSYNSIEFLATIFAANSLGAIAMPINWRLAAPELRYLLEHSRGACARVRRGAHRPGRRGHEGSRRRPRAGVRLGTEDRDGWERFADLEAEPLPQRAHGRAATTSIG